MVGFQTGVGGTFGSKVNQNFPLFQRNRLFPKTCTEIDLKRTMTKKIVRISQCVPKLACMFFEKFIILEIRYSQWLACCRKKNTGKNSWRYIYLFNTNIACAYLIHWHKPCNSVLRFKYVSVVLYCLGWCRIVYLVQ